ncbi:hypothetical protein GN316_15050 [Xylophilus sp. Kf1]|nr:hypothetical protein [Xylophilus sp. Kf1]
MSALVAGSLSLLGGCSSVGSFSGAAAGVASGGISGNPAVGIAVGIGVRAIVDDTVDRLSRRWSDEEQQSIAVVAGGLDVGERKPWNVRHAVAYRNTDGQVQVVRSFQTALTTCKEAMFTLSATDPAAPPLWFATLVCQGPRGWQWAAAEPAVARWGALQ